MSAVAAPARRVVALATARAAARRAELRLGKLSLELLERGLAAAAGLRPGVVPTPSGPIAIASRLRPDDPAPLVCVHGFGGDKETWLLLAPRIPRARGVVLIDLPGHGASAAIAGETASPRRYAEAVAAVLDHLRLDRVVMMGNSLGGGIALRLAAMQPDRVAALVLVASVGPSSATSETVQRWRTGENPLIPADSESDAEAFMRLVTEKPPRVPRAIFRYVASRRAGADVRLRPLFAGFVDARGADAVPTDLAAIRQPALILHGACDRVIPVTTAHELAAGLPNAQLEVMDGIGHAPHLEAPAATMQRLDGFLRGAVGTPDKAR